MTIHITLSNSLFKDVTRKHGPISCYLQPIRASTSSKRKERPPRNLIFDHSKFTPEIIPRSCGQYFHHPPPQNDEFLMNLGFIKLKQLRPTKNLHEVLGEGKWWLSEKTSNEKKVTHPHIYFSPKPRESQGPDTRNNRIILGRC